MKIWWVHIYIINGIVARNKFDNISNRDYLWYIHRPHDERFGEYTSQLSSNDMHTHGYLQLQKYIEGFIHNNTRQINLVPYKLDLSETPFSYKTIFKYELQLPSLGEKIDLKLMNDEKFTITYIFDAIPNSPAGHQIPSQAHKNMDF